MVLENLLYRLEDYFMEAIFPLPSLFHNAAGLTILCRYNFSENQQNNRGNIRQCNIPSAGLDRIEQTCSLRILKPD